MAKLSIPLEESTTKPLPACPRAALESQNPGILKERLLVVVMGHPSRPSQWALFLGELRLSCSKNTDFGERICLLPSFISVLLRSLAPLPIYMNNVTAGDLLTNLLPYIPRAMEASL